MKETVTLNSEEQRRLLILNQVERGVVSVAEAAELMDLSVRQVHRLRVAYRNEGAPALVHGNQGRVPAHALAPAVRQQVLTLAQTTYADCNHQHMSELLAERDGIQISRASLRRILLAAGVTSPRTRRAPTHRRRRERYPQEGMLLQLDASRHDWLQGRGPWLTLVGAIDDATDGAGSRHTPMAQGMAREATTRATLRAKAGWKNRASRLTTLARSLFPLV